jgi:hypothetical protein
MKLFKCQVCDQLLYFENLRKDARIGRAIFRRSTSCRRPASAMPEVEPTADAPIRGRFRGDGESVLIQKVFPSLEITKAHEPPRQAQ